MKREPELETYLAGDSDLSQIYRSGDKELPSEQLNQAIVSAAWQSVRVSTSRRSWSVAWTLPVSLAAAVLLGASLVLFIHTSREFETHTAAIPRVAIPAVAPSAINETNAAIAKASDKNSIELQDDGQSDNVELSTLRVHSSAEITTAGVQTQTGEPQPPEEDTQLTRKLALPEPHWTVELLDDPVSWLGFIEHLQHQGRLDEVVTHIQAFRARYPDVELPETLLAVAKGEPVSN